MALIDGEVKSSLESIGISASIITIAVVLATVGFIYKNVLEIQLTKIKIDILKKDNAKLSVE